MNVHEEWRQLHYFELNGHLHTLAIWSQGKRPPMYSGMGAGAGLLAWKTENVFDFIGNRSPIGRLPVE